MPIQDWKGTLNGLAKDTNLRYSLQANHRKYHCFKQYAENDPNVETGLVSLTYSGGATLGMAEITIKYAIGFIAANNYYSSGIFHVLWKKFDATAVCGVGALACVENSTASSPTFDWSGNTLRIKAGRTYALIMVDIEITTFGQAAEVGVTFP